MDIESMYIVDFDGGGSWSKWLEESIFDFVCYC